jgi:radical SAM superfamily enzyme YgiQ (UPF0313 family)
LVAKLFVDVTPLKNLPNYIYTKEEMNILLIHPRMGHGPVTDQDRGTLRAKLFTDPVLTLPAVAATIPKKHHIRLLHEDQEDIDYSKKFDLVGISCFTMFAPRAYEIADEYRTRNVPVVLGGYHPTAMPKEAKQHADSVVIGEAEQTLPRLLIDFEKGKLKPFYRSRTWAKPEDISPLRRDLLHFKPLVGGLFATRGCPHRCEFCSITCFYKHTYRKRPIENVIKEMKDISNKFVLLHDANLTVDLDYSKALFRAMIREKINKRWQGNGNIYALGKDEDFLRLARESGCICWATGIESVSQESLNGVKKFNNKVKQYGRWIKNIRKNGMTVMGLFMFGFDEDTPDIFDKTLDALYEWEIDRGEFSILTPLPGTPVFDKLEKEGRILTKDWSQYTQTRVVFQPKNMTPEELFEGTRKVAKEFYKPINFIKRSANIMRVSLNPSTLMFMPIADLNMRTWYRRDFNI